MTEQTPEPTPIATFDTGVITDASPAPGQIPDGAWQDIRVAVWTATYVGARAGNTTVDGVRYRAVFRRREDADGVSVATSIVDVFLGDDPDVVPERPPLHEQPREIRALVAVEVAERIMRGIAEGDANPLPTRLVLAETMHFTTITTASLVKDLATSDLIAAYARDEVRRILHSANG